MLTARRLFATVRPPPAFSQRYERENPPLALELVRQQVATDRKEAAEAEAAKKQRASMEMSAQRR